MWKKYQQETENRKSALGWKTTIWSQPIKMLCYSRCLHHYFITCMKCVLCTHFVQFRKCLAFSAVSLFVNAIPKNVLSLKQRQYTFNVHSKIVNKIVQTFSYTHPVSIDTTQLHKQSDFQSILIRQCSCCRFPVRAHPD